jgi:hypothetical protein
MIVRINMVSFIFLHKLTVGYWVYNCFLYSIGWYSHIGLHDYGSFTASFLFFYFILLLLVDFFDGNFE